MNLVCTLIFSCPSTLPCQVFSMYIAEYKIIDIIFKFTLAADAVEWWLKGILTKWSQGSPEISRELTKKAHCLIDMGFVDIYVYIYMVSIVTSRARHDVLITSDTANLFRTLFKMKTNKMQRSSFMVLCYGNQSMTRRISSQLVSNVESISLAWRHHNFPEPWCTQYFWRPPDCFRTAGFLWSTACWSAPPSISAGRLMSSEMAARWRHSITNTQGVHVRIYESNSSESQLFS